MERLLNPREAALLSTDNTQTFQNPELDEFYIPGLEIAAFATKELITVLRPLGVLTVSIEEQHPDGHISFASSYKNKKHKDFVTLEEIKDWTDTENGLSEKAKFTVDELRAHIIEKGGFIQVWKKHSPKGKQGVEVTPPLFKSDFDVRIIKGDKPNFDAYSGFYKTDLEEQLIEREIKINVVTGVVTEICVDATAVDSNDNGFETYVVEDAVVGITQEGHNATLEKLRSKGIHVVTSKQLIRLFCGN